MNKDKILQDRLSQLKKIAGKMCYESTCRFCNSQIMASRLNCGNDIDGKTKYENNYFCHCEQSRNFYKKISDLNKLLEAK